MVMDRIQKMPTSTPLEWTIEISTIHINITEPTHSLVIHSKGQWIKKEGEQDTNINSNALDNRDVNNID